jgi:oligopeptide transport system substrate-binding protein
MTFPTVRHRALHAALAIAAAFVFLPAALKAEDRPINRPLIYNLGAEPRTIDPGKATETMASVVLRNVFEGLTRPMPDGSLQPAAAKSWEVSEDGKKLTFHLDPAGRWSNGDKVTAQDFVYAWRRVLEPSFAAEYAYVLFPVVGAEDFNQGRSTDPDSIGARAVDDLTLEVDLIAPTPYLLSFLDHSTFMPVHRPTVEENPNWSLRAETYICNGPFKIDEIVPKQRIAVSPNPHHRDLDSIKLNKIIFREIEDSGTALTEFETGRINGIHTGLPPSDIPRLKAENKLKQLPELSTYFVCFNTRKPPFDNREVRKAFALGINRAALALIQQTDDKPATGYVPRGFHMPDGSDFRDHYGPMFQDNDVAGGKAALAAAGYPGGKGLPQITYLYNTDERHKKVAEFLNGQWKKNLDVNVRLQNQEWKVLIENRTQGNFQVCRHGWVGDYEDPMTFLDMFLSTSDNNDAHWANAEYDSLIAQARLESDQAKRMELFAKAEKILMDDFVIAPLLFYVQNFTLDDRLKGYERSILQTVRFDRAYWEK